jgi:fatty-acid peroxygenase
MPQIPRDKTFDCSLALLTNGYRFISERCERNGADLFRTRMLLRPAVCVSGEEAARMFYQPDRFSRKLAMPPQTLMSLQDVGSVQQMQGDAHRHRKQMFMSLMSPESIKRLGDLFEQKWTDRVGRLERSGAQVSLHHEVEDLLCRAVCEWTGIRLTEEEAPQRAKEFSAMIDGAGAIGPRNWKGLALRHRTERWAQKLISDIRHSPLSRPERSPLETIALYRDEHGKTLPAKVAAVELINILRPTVAVGRFITFAALALHTYPEYRDRLRTGGDEWREMFTQEVRRYYPFFPLVAGNAKEDIEWQGHHIEKGTWVMLDLHGTNHDARSWKDPHEFRPERFKNWPGNAYSLVPQGAGEFDAGHRCPGEWITIELIKRALHMLVSGMDYEVPPQDLTVRLSRLPAIPESRFIISRVRARH